MSAVMEGYAAAQRNYDRAEPIDIADEPKDPFDAQIDTQSLIHDLAHSRHTTAWMWFEDEGLAPFAGERMWFGSADILRNLCRAWMKDPEIVFAACGTEFWENMKDLAYERWAA